MSPSLLALLILACIVYFIACLVKNKPWKRCESSVTAPQVSVRRARITAVKRKCVWLVAAIYSREQALVNRLQAVGVLTGPRHEPSTIKAPAPPSRDSHYRQTYAMPLRT